MARAKSSSSAFAAGLTDGDAFASCAALVRSVQHPSQTLTGWSRPRWGRGMVRDEHCPQNGLPHCRQWCLRLFNRLKRLLQRLHILLSVHSGGAAAWIKKFPAVLASFELLEGNLTPDLFNSP